jgi:hypothetical protein
VYRLKLAPFLSCHLLMSPEEVAVPEMGPYSVTPLIISRRSPVINVLIYSLSSLTNVNQSRKTRKYVCKQCSRNISVARGMLMYLVPGLK